MLRRKRKTLPKDFDDLLQTAALEDLIAVLDRCEVDARGGYSRSTAAGFVDCPDDLLRRLAERGADLDAPDGYGRTPLHERASLGRSAQIPLLLDLGARLETEDRNGRTAAEIAAIEHRPDALRVLLERGAVLRDPTALLQQALETTQNAVIARMAVVASILLAAGAAPTPAAQESVRRIGAGFEFHRHGFAPEHLAQTEEGLARLQSSFDVEPAERRRVHDGTSRIEVEGDGWRERFRALWDLLVPSSGPAGTVQGEAVRITGRIGKEVLDEGGANWDDGFRAMLAALQAHLASGQPLPDGEQAEVRNLVHALRRGRGSDEQLDRLTRSTVDWVGMNPDPVPLDPPPYRR